MANSAPLTATTVPETTVTGTGVRQVLVFDLHTQAPVIALTDGRRSLRLPSSSSSQDKTESLTSSSTQGKAQDPVVVTFRAATAPGVIFSSQADRAAHYMTDWHRINLKRRAQALPMLSKEEFGNSLPSEDSGYESDSDDASMNHGLGEEEEEDDDDDEVLGPGSPKVEFELADGVKVSVWKALLSPSPKERHIALNLYLPQFELLCRPDSFRYTSVFMLGGGRAACALFDGTQLIAHKTIQRYTTRRKQGGAQSSHDNSKGNAKSAGAQIRRGQQLKYVEDVQRLLRLWRNELTRCSRIFLVAPGVSNARIVFGEFDGALSLRIPDCLFLPSLIDLIQSLEDQRVRKVPFTTSRATLIEAVRVHRKMLTVEVTSSHSHEPLLPAETVSVPVSEPVPSYSSNSNEMSESSSFSPTSSSPQTVDLVIEAIMADDINALLDLYSRAYVRPLGADGILVPPLYMAVSEQRERILSLLLEMDTSDIDVVNLHDYSRTALHLACAKEYTSMVFLLLEALADPTIVDDQGKTPYDLVQSKSLRREIRLFAGRDEANLSLWPWARAHVEPLTVDNEAAQQARKREAEREKRARAKARKAASKKTERLRADEEERLAQEKEAVLDSQRRAQEKLGALSEREKRALAAERRLAQTTGSVAAGRCEVCAQALPPKGFERLGYKYCSVECVAKHRAILEKLGVGINQL